MVEIRDARNAADAEACGRILYSAFRSLAEQHKFAPDFPSTEAAIGLASKLISDPGFYGVVAEQGEQIVGSNFMDERSAHLRHRPDLCGTGGSKSRNWQTPDAGGS